MKKKSYIIFSFFVFITLFSLLSIITPKFINAQGIRPPQGSGCIQSEETTRFCSQSYPTVCTDNANYRWCCATHEACGEAIKSISHEDMRTSGCDICGCYRGGITLKCPDCDTECWDCINVGDAWTALGCITTSDPQEFVAWILKSAIGIAGGIAILLMIFGGFLIILSTGDPKRLQTGKEILTSAIVGLLVIIFSIFLLRIIGVEILKIPGFK